MRAIIFLFLLLSPFSSNAMPKAKLVITTTITPISSLAAMIAGDKAEIVTIACTNGCPHHYFLKPSDLEKMSNTDLFIYIDEKFDIFANPLLEKFNKKSIKISSLDGVKIINHNLHLWLLPDNATAILRAVTKTLTQMLPQHQEYFNRNLALHLEKMRILSSKLMGLEHKNIVLLSDSAEYLFNGIDNIIRQYQSEYSSVKSIKSLKKLSLEDRCFIISSDQDLSKYQKLLGNKVVTISTENWEIKDNLESLYYLEYEKIINKIISGCSN